MHILIIMELPESEKCVISVCIKQNNFVCYVLYYLKYYVPRIGQ